MAGEVVLELRGAGLDLTSGAGTVRVLGSVDLALHAGETLAVVGPSGSGKSSLIAIAAGLEAATRGEVRLFGSALETLGEDERARLRRGRAGLVFQSFHLLPNMTAEDNVAAPLEIARRPGARAAARAWLERVGLGARGRHYPHQLSGGEQQRVALARALAVEPQLLFADEPTGNLDQDSARKVADLMFGLLAETGAALLMVTHDLDLAARAGSVRVMRGGSLEAA